MTDDWISVSALTMPAYNDNDACESKPDVVVGTPLIAVVKPCEQTRRSLSTHRSGRPALCATERAGAARASPWRAFQQVLLRSSFATLSRIRLWVCTRQRTTATLSLRPSFGPSAGLLPLVSKHASIKRRAEALAGRRRDVVSYQQTRTDASLDFLRTIYRQHPHDCGLHVHSTAQSR